MRRIIMVFLILGLIAAPASAETTFPGGTFVDDDDSIFESNIEAIAAAGVTKGCNAEHTSFCPEAAVTRGQMAAFLVRALGLTEIDPNIDFTDDNTSIFENDIKKLATAGITKGCNTERTSFCPGAAVTRGQMAAFLVRALGLTEQDPEIDFTDDNTSIFETDIEKLATAGITRGCNAERTKFCPDAAVTRGQMAALLSRAMKYPLITVPDRGEATTGINLELSEAAATQGCVFANGAVCTATIQLATGQPFYFDEGFFLAPWSKASSSEKSVFGSDALQLDAVLNGTALELVEKPLIVTNDIGYRIFTFQFPDSWTGTHHLDVRLINGQSGLDMTIKVTIVLTPPVSAAGSRSSPA